MKWVSISSENCELDNGYGLSDFLLIEFNACWYSNIRGTLVTSSYSCVNSTYIVYFENNPSSTDYVKFSFIDNNHFNFISSANNNNVRGFIRGIILA